MDYLKKLRKDKNITQVEISKILKISRPSYMLIEQGMKDLTLNQALVLSDLYQVDINKLSEDISLFTHFSTNLVEESKSVYQKNISKQNLIKIKDLSLEKTLIFLLGDLIANYEVGMDFIKLLIFQLEYKYYVFYKKKIFNLKYIKVSERNIEICGLDELLDELLEKNKILLINQNDANFKIRKYIPLVRNELDDLEFEKREFIKSLIGYYKKFTKYQILLEIKSYPIWYRCGIGNNIKI